MMTDLDVCQVYTIVVQAPLEAVWKALTDPEMTKRYWFDAVVESTWRAGERITYTTDGTLAIDGTIERIEPQAVLSYTFKNLWYAPAAHDEASRVTWTIEPDDDGRTRVMLVHDRFAGETQTYRHVRRGWTAIVSALQTLLETKETLALDLTDEMAGEPSRPRGRGHVYEIYIKAPPERIWHALTSGDESEKYFPDRLVTDRWEVGAPLRYADGDRAIIEGEILEVQPPRLLRHTFKSRWNPLAENEPPSRVTWEITPVGGACRVTLIHDDFADESITYGEVQNGWPGILSGLKRATELA